MSTRDFLNRGLRIEDRTVASGAVPEADPTLITDGVALPLTSGGISVLPPFLLVVVDFDGGAAPEATLEFWGHMNPPAAGSTLISEWQHLATAEVSDVVGTTPTIALFPLVGLSRFEVCVKGVDGAPTSIRLRLLGISHHAADALIALGIVPMASVNAVDVVRVGGNVLHALPVNGILPVANAGVTSATATRVVTGVGVPVTLTANFADTVSAWYDCSNAHEVRFDITTSANTPATIEIDPQWSPDDGTTVLQHPVIANVGVGPETVSDLYIVLIGRAGVAVPNGGHSMTVKRPKRALLMRVRLRDPGAVGADVYVDATSEI